MRLSVSDHEVAGVAEYPSDALAVVAMIDAKVIAPAIWLVSPANRTLPALLRKNPFVLRKPNLVPVPQVRMPVFVRGALL